MEYKPRKIEKKWQRMWEKTGIFKARDSLFLPAKRKRGGLKFYILDMFPYPSAQGLHVGHPRGYITTDVFAHFMRRKGFNILHPMGWDAFGLPTENYAIKTGIHPEIITKRNIKRMKKQLKLIGLGYDWSREINTTDPEYYKWTQQIFLLLYKMGLAYEATLPINWCPSCKTGLANEEVIEGRCERCGTEVIKKDLRQWVLKITVFSDKLLKDLDLLDWPEKIKEMQRNWIGRSEGWEIKFKVATTDKRQETSIKVFTTRTDTLFGCTYLVLAPEHQIIQKLKDQILNFKSVERYIEKSKKKTERERISKVKEKAGIEIKGIKAVNPVNGRAIPIFVADYVLIHYGTGAIMAVPAHDQRDFDFAKKYNLPVIEVIKPYYVKEELPKETPLVISDGRFEKAYEGEGILINSGRFIGMKSKIARERIGEWLTKKNLAKKAIYFKLRDWIFSRQRYWGEPIPIVHCQKCGIVPLGKKDLPLKLPRVKKYQPTGTGESPLAAIKKWVNTKCPKCKGPAKRETNTMPQWAGSCWYFIAYLLDKNKEFAWNKRKINYWLPVDLYVGGAEHAVLHLLYARFWTKVLYDAGLIKFKEPFLKLRTLGLILAPDGQKMSKSRGNVILPDKIIEEYGADAFRLYEMFMGPFDEAINWNVQGIVGMRRFLEKVWKLFDGQKSIVPIKEDKELEKLVHKTIKKVTEDIENFRFNTAISALMILVNNFQGKNYGVWYLKTLLLLLAPFAPHIVEELWQKYFVEKPEFKINRSIHNQPWPKYDPKLVKEEMITLVIQVNGKVRDKIEVKADISEKKAKKLATSREKIKKRIKDKKIKKVFFVPGKLINIVV
ncbi:leucine--tRNA ligase [Patescibacteria group bacterium]|nr:leucine--tRNA ligase [Patescibacteria group bacterium]